MREATQLAEDKKEWIERLRTRRDGLLTELKHVESQMREMGETSIPVNPAYKFFPKIKFAVRFYMSEKNGLADEQQMIDDLLSFGVPVDEHYERGGARTLVQKAISNLVNSGELVRDDKMVRTATVTPAPLQPQPAG